MGPLLYVDGRATIKPKHGMAVLTLASGEQDFTFALTFHALCALLEEARRGVNAVCEETRHDADVIGFPVAKPRRSRAKRA
jgi:hypothetical protein